MTPKQSEILAALEQGPLTYLDIKKRVTRVQVKSIRALIAEGVVVEKNGKYRTTTNSKRN